ncbi:MAG: SPOR domain-containing protein [Candidatus Neomarinimicrobiota bacterium]
MKILRGWFLWGLLLVTVGAQDLRLYFSLVQEGRTSEVQRSLPDLLNNYPDDPGVLYLHALTVSDGDSSIQLYLELLARHPASEYADDVEMKIAEYLFSRGLYSQASSQFGKVLLKYGQSDHQQRALDLMVNSYLATGELDSAAIYLARIKRKHPRLNFDYGIPGIDEVALPPAEVELTRLDQREAQEKLRQTRTEAPRPAVVEKPVVRPWIVQVGAFSNYANANSLLAMLTQNGYQVEVHEVSSNNRRLHAVRVMRYASKAEADAVGEELNRKYNLNFLILNRPE